jgi:hypothetical protein
MKTRPESTACQAHPSALRVNFFSERSWVKGMVSWHERGCGIAGTGGGCGMTGGEVVVSRTHGEDVG